MIKEYMSWSRSTPLMCTAPIYGSYYVKKIVGNRKFCDLCGLEVVYKVNMWPLDVFSPFQGSHKLKVSGSYENKSNSRKFSVKKGSPPHYLVYRAPTRKNKYLNWTAIVLGSLVVKSKAENLVKSLIGCWIGNTLETRRSYLNA